MVVYSAGAKGPVPPAWGDEDWGRGVAVRGETPQVRKARREVERCIVIALMEENEDLG